MSLRIFVAGATGVLGRGLIQQFSARGHSVIGLSRDSGGEEVIRSLGGESRSGDIFDVDSLSRAADGADVVIHAATSIPTKTRTSARDWVMNDRLRREGTRALTECAARIGAGLYLQQSIVWLARPKDGSYFDETSKPEPEPLILSALDSETIALQAGTKFGFKVSVLRCGFFYGPDSSHTRMMGDMLMKRRFPIIGSGLAELSCLQTNDAAGAFVAAAEGNKTGLWHVVDDQIVTVRDLLVEFALRLGAPAPRSVPAWLARLIAGRYAVNFLTSPVRTSNAKFRADFGWQPRFPTYKEGLDQIVSIWKTRGFGNI